MPETFEEVRKVRKADLMMSGDILTSPQEAPDDLQATGAVLFLAEPVADGIISKYQSWSLDREQPEVFLCCPSDDL